MAKSKTTVEKFIRDPVHDLIRIQDDVVLRLLDTHAMQRLKYIRQLGLAWIVYPGAVHTRFSHSLGAFHLAGRVLNQLGEPAASDSAMAIRISALMHDAGHGAFSHLFERALKQLRYPYYQKHEDWTIQIIEEDDQVHGILGSQLADDVKAVISSTFVPEYLAGIVSSQFDVDRMDYMLRDSIMTGVHYGRFDLNWMLRSMSLSDSRLSLEDPDEGIHAEKRRIVIDIGRGLSSLESYLLGNFYLYRHVYYHKTIRSAEAMLVAIVKRAVDLALQGRPPSSMPNALFSVAESKEISIDEYLRLNDVVFTYLIMEWSKTADDKILRDLCSRLINRELFASIEVEGLSNEQYLRFRTESNHTVKRAGYSEDYYCLVSDSERDAYKNFFDLLKKGKVDQEIFCRRKNEDPAPLTSLENEYPIVGCLKQLKIATSFVHVPKELKPKVEGIMEGARR